MTRSGIDGANDRAIPGYRASLLAVSEPNMRPSVFSALLSNSPEALRLLPSRFREEEAWDAAAKRVSGAGRRASGVPSDVLEEMRRQSRELPFPEAREGNLGRLSQPGASVVVTGQQVGLFGGPLYTIHKAATAIARARGVEARTGTPCIPVFWLQTEDHDYAEIASVAVAAPSGRATFRLPEDPHPSRTSVAHRVLPPDIDATLASVDEALRSLPFAADVCRLLRTHFVAGRSLAAAFGGLMAELFRDEGLVVLDPRVSAVARAAVPLFTRVLEEHDAIAADLAARCEAIHAAGFEVQVPARPGASLLFFHAGGVEGARHRLIRKGDGFETPEGPATVDELRRMMQDEPLRFSTSALLRPLVQDVVLPTCAYVGGPAEVSYFAQLPPLYERLGVTMPLIAPRARLRILDPSMRSLLERLGISSADVETTRDALLARVARRHEGESAADIQARLLAPLALELDALESLGLHGLGDPIGRARQACERAIARLAGKVERTLNERDQVVVDRVDRVRLALFPDDRPQERAYGFLALAAKVGIEPLIRSILVAAESLDPSVKDVLP